MTPICPSRTTIAFGAFRKVMVEYPVPWNVAELFTLLVCHAFLGKTITISTKNVLDMLGAVIYDEIIRFFLYTQSLNSEVRQISLKNITCLNKIK